MSTLFLHPFRAPAIWLLLAWTLIGRFLVLLIDMFVGNAPMAVALAIGFLLPVWYLLIGSLSIYAQKHLLHVARGLGDEPIPQITDLNPFKDSLAAQLCLLLLIPLSVIATFGPQLTAGQAVLPALIFPLLWLGVMLEGSLAEGLHPASLWRIISGLNVFYLAAAALLSGCIGVFFYSLVYWHDLFVFAATGYLYLFCHGLAGKILYWRRGPLYLHTERSPEQDHARELAGRHAALNQLFDELQQLCNTGRVVAAHDKLVRHIDGAFEEMDPIVHERLLGFQDKRLTLQHAVYYLGRLLAADKRPKAWALFKTCVEMDDRFRPLEDSALLELTGAAPREDTLLVDEVLSDFATAYPDSQLIAAVKFRRARILVELLGRVETGHELIREIAQTHPEFAAEQRYRDYRTKHGIH
jgi:hypothetical protein